ncbi:MAG: phage BR0599 family protein [Desulfobacterales bacterium]|nr:phage BR0599 family protein [Desulfobacterales bacterium]
MSNFTVKEYSVDSGEPFELYEFTRGVWHSYLTTRKTEFWVHDLQIYKPASISRDKILHGSEIGKDALTITLPINHDLVTEFLHTAPEDTVSVTVKKLHRGLTYADAVVIWKGRVIAVEPQEDETANLVCESIYTSMRRNGLRLRCELICQKALYSTACGVNQPAYRVDDVIFELPSPTTLSMTALTGYAEGWFTGGILQSINDQRYILSSSGNTLTISRPLASLFAGHTVALYPGCNRIMATCLSKFDNLDNFLGFPWHPAKNPFTISIK